MYRKRPIIVILIVVTLFLVYNLWQIVSAMSIPCYCLPVTECPPGCGRDSVWYHGPCCCNFGLGCCQYDECLLQNCYDSQGALCGAIVYPGGNVKWYQVLHCGGSGRCGVEL